jgi:hypothetical protein
VYCISFIKFSLNKFQTLSIKFIKRTDLMIFFLQLNDLNGTRLLYLEVLMDQILSVPFSSVFKNYLYIYHPYSNVNYSYLYPIWFYTLYILWSFIYKIVLLICMQCYHYKYITNIYCKYLLLTYSVLNFDIRLISIIVVK